MPAVREVNDPITDQSGKVRAHVWVQGYVQGVGFRWFLHKKAAEIGAVGFVRNLDDGRLEAVFEGTPDQVEELISNVRSGPDRAHVQSVDLLWEMPTGEYDELEVI